MSYEDYQQYWGMIKETNNIIFSDDFTGIRPN